MSLRRNVMLVAAPLVGAAAIGGVLAFSVPALAAASPSPSAGSGSSPSTTAPAPGNQGGGGQGSCPNM
jgi:hypothetical protein